MQFLKADTSVKVVIGPAVDKTDGLTPETTLDISTADEAELVKHDAASVTDISGRTWAAITNADGYYNLTLTAGDLDTEGMVTILINDDSLCLPILARFMVVNANVYDSLFAAAATDYLKVKDDEGNTIANEAKQDIIDTNIDTLVARLTAARAGYLDELAAANIPTDVDTLKTYCDILDHATNGLANIKTLIDTIDTVVDAIKAKTDLQPAGVQKNVALANFGFLMVLSSDHITPATSKTITAQISKDGGAFASCTNSVTEIGNGVYKISLTQTEMNADIIVLKFTEADCDQRTIVFVTST